MAGLLVLDSLVDRIRGGFAFKVFHSLLNAVDTSVEFGDGRENLIDSAEDFFKAGFKGRHPVFDRGFLLYLRLFDRLFRGLVYVGFHLFGFLCDPNLGNLAL